MTICPDFLPTIFMYSDLWEGVNRFYGFEKHTTKRYYYELREYFNESEDERTIGQNYAEILKKIENGEINASNLGIKM